MTTAATPIAIASTDSAVRRGAERGIAAKRRVSAGAWQVNPRRRRLMGPSEIGADAESLFSRPSSITSCRPGPGAERGVVGDDDQRDAAALSASSRHS